MRRRLLENSRGDSIWKWLVIANWKKKVNINTAGMCNTQGPVLLANQPMQLTPPLLRRGKKDKSGAEFKSLGEESQVRTDSHRQIVNLT